MNEAISEQLSGEDASEAKTLARLRHEAGEFVTQALKGSQIGVATRLRTSGTIQQFVQVVVLSPNVPFTCATVLLFEPGIPDPENRPFLFAASLHTVEVTQMKRLGIPLGSKRTIRETQAYQSTFPPADQPNDLGFLPPLTGGPDTAYHYAKDDLRYTNTEDRTALRTLLDLTRAQNESDHFFVQFPSNSIFQHPAELLDTIWSVNVATVQSGGEDQHVYFVNQFTGGLLTSNFLTIGPELDVPLGMSLSRLRRADIDAGRTDLFALSENFPIGAFNFALRRFGR
ncbi:MAG: hypothetical protein ACE5DX_02290 [Candidatus Dojkabacteria bacterium]